MCSLLVIPVIFFHLVFNDFFLWPVVFSTIFSSSSIQRHQFLFVQPYDSPVLQSYVTTGKTMDLTTHTVCLLKVWCSFHFLSRSIIVFLPSSRCGNVIFLAAFVYRRKAASHFTSFYFTLHCCAIYITIFTCHLLFFF